MSELPGPLKRFVPLFAKTSIKPRCFGDVTTGGALFHGVSGAEEG